MSPRVVARNVWSVVRNNTIVLAYIAFVTTIILLLVLDAR